MRKARVKEEPGADKLALLAVRNMLCFVYTQPREWAYHYAGHSLSTLLCALGTTSFGKAMRAKQLRRTMQCMKRHVPSPGWIPSPRLNVGLVDPHM
jgi:hypothetical protein